MRFAYRVGILFSLLPALVAGHPGSGAGNGYPRPEEKRHLDSRECSNPMVYCPDTSKKAETSTSISATSPPASSSSAIPTTSSDPPPSSTISTSSSQVPSPTGTSGPLFGDDGIAACDDLTCSSGADWLVASLCAISKCNKQWPESLISIIDGDTLVKDATTVNVTTFDLEMNPHFTSVKYTDAVGDRKDNSGTAWYGGAFDVAIAKMGGLGVINGELQTHLDTNLTFLEQAGLYGLTYLTGMYSTSETTIPTNNDGVLPLIEKTNGSPVIIRTSSTCTKLTPDQYYTVYTYSDTDVVLWDPMASATSKSKVSISIDDFRTSIYALQHLDWPHFNPAIAPSATSISISGSTASTSSSTAVTSSASAIVCTVSASQSQSGRTATASAVAGSTAPATATASAVTGSTASTSISAVTDSTASISASSANSVGSETASAAASTYTDDGDDGCDDDDETTSAGEYTSFTPTPTATISESATATASGDDGDDGCDDDVSTSSSASATATSDYTASESPSATASTTTDADGDDC